MVYFVLPFLFAVFTGSEHSHIEPIVLTHGGVDNVNELRVIQRAEGVKKAAAAGYKLLKRGGTVIDAVEAAVRVLEDDININAGSGSVLNVEGEMEMDACVMVGFNLTSGSVAGVKYIAHPVSLARLVMEKTSFFGLAGEGAHRFAKDQGVPLVKQQLLMAPHVKKDLADYLKNVSKITTCGSAGAVALDEHGHVAAATSSGGMIGKLPGRVSDSSIVGAGLYASDEIGATVVTGHGEAIARYVMASEIINLMKRGFEAGVATRNVVKGITERFRKPTGAISLSKNGQIGISFTTDKMAWAYQLRDEVHYGVDDYDHFSERIKV